MAAWGQQIPLGPFFARVQVWLIVRHDSCIGQSRSAEIVAHAALRPVRDRRGPVEGTWSEEAYLAGVFGEVFRWALPVEVIGSASNRKARSSIFCRVPGMRLWRAMPRSLLANSR